MRKRYEIETDGTRTDKLILEVLLDIRTLLEESKEKMNGSSNTNKAVKKSLRRNG